MTALAATSLTERLLGGVEGAWTARVVTTEPGVAAGLARVADAGGTPLVRDGDPVEAGTPLAELTAGPGVLAGAEDVLLGDLGVACGVATNAARLAGVAPRGLRVVCGGWKKLPAAMKPAVRDGLAAAGVGPRLVDGDFVYVGKNAVTLLGGVEAATRAAAALGHGPVAVQVTDPVDAVRAATAGAGVVMVDTGDLADLAAARAALHGAGLRERVVLAYGGGVTLSDLAAVAAAGADVVDVGRAILDRPLLDLRFQVLGRA